MSSSMNSINASKRFSSEMRNSKRGRTEEYECVGDGLDDNSPRSNSKRQTLDQNSESARKKTLQVIRTSDLTTLHSHCDKENSVVFHKNHDGENQTASGEENSVHGRDDSSCVSDKRQPLSENVIVKRFPEVGRLEDFQTFVGRCSTSHQDPRVDRVAEHSDNSHGGNSNGASSIRIDDTRNTSPGSGSSVSSTSSSSSHADDECSEELFWQKETLETLACCQSLKTLTLHFMTPADLHTRWPRSNETWKAMELRDREYPRAENVLQNHPKLSLFLRSDVIVKMATLCEKMVCSRETFHLAVDYIDRYLSLTHGWDVLQFIVKALACLLLAIQMEYKNKPSLTPLYQCAGEYRCDKPDLMTQMRDVMRDLEWKLSPVTTNTWLSSYLQLGQMDRNIPEPENLLTDVKYDRMTSLLISRTIDLSLMDDKSRQFPYKVIAASALYFHSSTEFATAVSGLAWSELEPCVKWMKPFFKVTMDRQDDPKLRSLAEVEGEVDVFEMQSSFINLSLFCRALALRKKLAKQSTTQMTSDELHPTLACKLIHPSQVKFGPGPELRTSVDGQWPLPQDLGISSAEIKSESSCIDICDTEKGNEEDEVKLGAATSKTGKEKDANYISYYRQDKNQERENFVYSESKIILDEKEISYIEISDDEDFNRDDLETGNGTEQQNTHDIKQEQENVHSEAEVALDRETYYYYYYIELCDEDSQVDEIKSENGNEQLDRSDIIVISDSDSDFSP